MLSWEREGSRQGWVGAERKALSLQTPLRIHGEMVPTTPEARFYLMLAYYYKWPDSTEKGRKSSWAWSRRLSWATEAEGLLLLFREEHQAWIGTCCEQI